MSGKTTWTDSEYKIFKNGVQFKPGISQHKIPTDTKVKPGILGHFQSISYTPRGLSIRVVTREGDEWELAMTVKIPGYTNFKVRLEKLVPGTLIETTVSNHYNAWDANEYFNGFKVINDNDLYVKPKDDFDF